MKTLHDLGITIASDQKAEQIFLSLFPDFLTFNYSSPSHFISHFWEIYEKQSHDNSINGKIFEYLLAVIFLREGLSPLYLEAKVAFVPNIRYDFLLYSPERGPLCFSAKTSLRERYKQADLEAIALKYVHRRALCYLITLNEKEASGVRLKIKSGDVIGLDDVIIANDESFDKLISSLKSYPISLAPTINVIESNHIIHSI